jgi:hypothetical protein
MNICADLRNSLAYTMEEYDCAVRKQLDRLLTLTEAAEMSGYSADHLGRCVRDGMIPNAGRPNSPRIRRADLPLRTGSRLPNGASAAHHTATRRIVDSALTSLPRSV